MSIQSINPATGEVIASFDEMSPEQLEARLSTAQKAFESWRGTGHAQRAELLRKVAAIMRRDKTSLARLITTEMGKLIAEAEAEVDLSADIFDYYADNAAEWLKDTPIQTRHGSAFLRHSPLGVLLGVEPWNFPFYQVARFAAPNVMIGNVVMVKHASNVPQCGIAVEKWFREAGAPEGIYTNLIVRGGKILELVGDARIRGVSLTGSEKAGEAIASEAGKFAKKAVLELGGSDAFIVLGDADLDAAVEWAYVGRMNNTGQCCVAAKRLIVVDAIYDRFVEKFVQRMSGLAVGDPLETSTRLGPLSSEQAARDLQSQVDRAVAGGARVLLGGHRIDRPGAYIEATVLADIGPDNPVFHEELFGPVAQVFRVRDEEEAVALANDSPFGLGGSVFSQDVARAQRVADRIDTGMVFINHPTWTAPELPFGGVKMSGYGRELSALGVREFVNQKLIRTSALDDPF